MTPLDLIAWAGAITATVILLGLAIAVVVAVVKALKKETHS